MKKEDIKVVYKNKVYYIVDANYKKPKEIVSEFEKFLYYVASEELNRLESKSTSPYRMKITKGRGNN